MSFGSNVLGVVSLGSTITSEPSSITGAFSSQLENITSAISGTTTITGTISVVLNNNTFQGSGTVSNILEGTLTSVLGTFTSIAEGTTIVIGNISVTLVNVISTMYGISGTYIPSIPQRIKSFFKMLGRR